MGLDLQYDNGSISNIRWLVIASAVLWFKAWCRFAVSHLTIMLLEILLFETLQNLFHNESGNLNTKEQLLCLGICIIAVVD